MRTIQPQNPSFGKTLFEGLCIGFVATQVLDVISSYLYEGQNEADRRAEDQAREGHQAYERAVDKIAAKLGTDLTEEQIKDYGWKFHRTFGFLGGVQYALLRRYFPKVGAGAGLGFGLGFFVLADEVMITAFKLVPGPKQFSFKAHARGLIAHLAWGVAAELTSRSFDVLRPYEQQTGPALEEDLGRPERRTDLLDANKAPRQKSRSKGTRAKGLSELGASLS